MHSLAPRQIVVATDFSDAATDALRTATLIADAFGGDVTAVHSDELAHPLARRHAEMRLHRWLEAYAPGRDVRGVVASGPPVETLLAAADEAGADLLAVGAHPRSGIERLYLGHFAEEVLRASTRPVLIVRRGMRAIRSIICGVGCGDDDRAALRAAVAWGDVFRAQVNVVHVIEPESSAHAAGELAAWLPPEMRTLCQARELVLHGDTAARLVAHAAALKADLIVVGSGDVESVIRRARCAVLAMRVTRDTAACERLGAVCEA